MLTRTGGYRFPRRTPAPSASLALEREGCALLPGLLTADETAALTVEVESI